VPGPAAGTKAALALALARSTAGLGRRFWAWFEAWFEAGQASRFCLLEKPSAARLIAATSHGPKQTNYRAFEN